MQLTVWALRVWFRWFQRTWHAVCPASWLWKCCSRAGTASPRWWLVSGRPATSWGAGAASRGACRRPAACRTASWRSEAVAVLDGGGSRHRISCPPRANRSTPALDPATSAININRYHKSNYSQSNLVSTYKQIAIVGFWSNKVCIAFFKGLSRVMVEYYSIGLK